MLVLRSHEVSLVQNKFKPNIYHIVRPSINQGQSGPKVLDQDKKRLTSVLNVHEHTLLFYHVDSGALTSCHLNHKRFIHGAHVQPYSCSHWCL